MEEFEEPKRQGLSIRGISRLTGFDRKAITKHLADPGIPRYAARPPQPSQLDAFKKRLEERLKAGVWNARVLLRELRELGYDGGYTILTDWLRPQGSPSQVAAVRRYQTPPGKQGQVDWGHLRTITINGEQEALSGFVFTLGFSRASVSIAGVDQKLGTLLRMHEEAFQQLGGVPDEILYDRMKTVVLGTEVGPDRPGGVWNSGEYRRPSAGLRGDCGR